MTESPVATLAGFPTVAIGPSEAVVLTRRDLICAARAALRR